MSLINQKQTKILTQFYQENIIPLSENETNNNILEYAPPHSEESYFSKRPQTRMTKEDFEFNFTDEKQAAKTLDKMWAGTKLENLGNKILKLAKHFPEVKDKTELSSSIYEMF
jgi:hypothetical protein